MSTETTAAFVAVTPLWRRIVNRLVPPEPVPDSWYELHDQVPQGGDMLTTVTRVRASWPAARTSGTVAELLGHTSLAMVMRYAHLMPGARAKAVASLPPPNIEGVGTGASTGTGRQGEGEK